MTTHSSGAASSAARFARRLAASTFVAAALSTSAAAALAATGAAVPITSDQFAPGWQSRAVHLFNEGPGIGPATTNWFVPALAPRGRYVLIDRKGDQAELIEGYRFEVDGNPTREIHMMLPPVYRDVQAIPLQDVPALANGPGGRRAL